MFVPWKISSSRVCKGAKTKNSKCWKCVSRQLYLDIPVEKSYSIFYGRLRTTYFKWHCNPYSTKEKYLWTLFSELFIILPYLSLDALTKYYGQQLNLFITKVLMKYVNGEWFKLGLWAYFGNISRFPPHFCLFVFVILYITLKI